MSGFVKRNSVNTVNPAGGVNPAQSPNVGQYGWTSFDAKNVNQIIEYVNLCKEYAQNAKDSADYVELRFSELQDFMNYIENVYNELKPIIDQIQPIYQDIIFRHEDTITRHIDVIRLHNEVTQDKILIDEIKQNAIDETNAIKDATIAESNAIKAATIAETTAIKVLATAEADRAKTEADRSAAEATKSLNSATASATSATKSETEAGKSAASAKEAAEIAEELRKGQVYRGTWNIEANKAYPPEPDTNSMWDVVLNEGSTQFVYDGKTWYWGDRLLFLKDNPAGSRFSQIESGSGVLSVNGKTGAVTLDAADVKAIPISGGTTTGMLILDGGLTMNNNYVRGVRDNIIMRDHGNGNVTLSASQSASGASGELYLGYNGTASGTNGYNTLRVRLDSPMNWKNSHALVDGEGKLNSERMAGPIRTEQGSDGVWHTIVGGTDTVNRGRTIIAAGEAGKHIADNTSSGSEEVHIGGDSTGSVFLHTDLQGGWASRKTVKVASGELYVVDGGSRVYHERFKPTPSDLGAVRKEGDDNIGSLKLASGKVMDATITHQSGYLSMYPYSSGYGLGGASGNRARMYYKEHNNGNPSDLSRGIVINSHDADGTSHPMDMWLSGYKVYHQGFKPSASDVGALPITGGNLTGMLRLDHGDYSHRMVLSGDILYYQGGHETDDTSQKVALSGFNGKGLTTARFVMANNETPTVAWGSTVHKIYHEGFKPDMTAILGEGASTTRIYEFSKPSGAVDGKYYPVLFSGTDARPDVFIETASASATHSMNNCSFKGQVRSGGWSDKGRYVSGDFVIYDSNERAIHSVVGGTEASNHYVIYVEARAFPIRVTADSNVSVTCTGKNTTYGTTTYNAGISDMTASGDYGTKTSLLMDFNRGSGFYNGNIRATYVDVRGSINATSRINIFDYNDNGAFITRRPGKTSYSMMGQDSNGNTMLGLGVDTSGYSSYFKVSASTLAYSNNGSSESRIYHEGFKPSLGELGGIASTGGTMTGALFWQNNRQYVNSANSNMYVAAQDGTVYLEGKNTPKVRMGSNDYNIYHQGNKPNAGDVGALATTGGTLTGKLTLRGVSSHIDIVETDSNDKTWRIEGQGNNLDFTESGVATRLRLSAGGGATLSGQMTVNGHIVLSQGNILKFPSANYSAGGQIFARDGGQYGSQMVISSGGNTIIGAGESGVALADSMVGSSTEHLYNIADGDVNIITNANTFDSRITHTFRASGQVELNGTVRTQSLYSYSENTKRGLILSSNSTGYGELVLNNEGTADWNFGIRAYGGNDWRIGSNRIYHEGFKPAVGDLVGGKAIGVAAKLGGNLDLDDFKTPGVYYQDSNANAVSGLNYPEALAGSLVVYQAAGIIQEYRIYNTSRLWRRAQYSSGAWTAWTKDYNSGNKPTAAELAVLPLSGGTMSGAIYWSDTNKYVNGAGDNIYVAAKNGRVYIEGASTPLARVGGIDYNIYHQGFKPTASDVGAMPISGGTFTNQVNLSHRKSAMRVLNQASITYYDGNNSWFHNYAEGAELVWGTGNDSAQTRRMVLTADGTVGLTGGINAAGNITSNSSVQGSYIQVNAGVNPMIELHKPGVSASAIYIDGSNFMRFCQSNGAAGEAAHYFSAHGDGLLTPRKYTSTMNSNRAWTSAGHAAFYNDSGPYSMGDGTYHAITSLYTVYNGVYAQEFSTGYFSPNTSWNDGKMVLQSYNASTGSATRWMFGNNGTLEPSTGSWRLTNGGQLTGSAYGGGTIAEWCVRTFAPISDGNLKTVLGESKDSALDKVSQMKFHEFVWKDTEATKQLTKRDVKVNSIGLIAQEVEAIDPSYTRDVETYAEDGSVAESTKTLDTANLLAVALKAIQELQAEVADLKEKLNGVV